MQITMIGHSTVLIETRGQRILIDPFFQKFGNLAYRRLTPPARTAHDLKVIDLVLLSHSHFDHIDYPYLRSLPVHIPILAQKHMFFSAIRAGKKFQYAEVWRSYNFGDVVITPVPAVHVAPTIGFIIQCELQSVYFAADTYFHPFMQKIHNRFKVDVALMPVTTYRIPMTMGEHGAVRAVELLEPKVVIPIHLGLQPRSPLLRTRQSPEGFASRLQQIDTNTQVMILREGESWNSPCS